MLSTLEEKVDPKHAAVIVVDVQNDFCHQDGLLGRSGQDMSAIQAAVPRIARFIDAARAVGTLVIFIQLGHAETTTSESRWELQLRSYRAMGLNDFPCPKGSWGAEFYVLAPKPGEPIVTKHRYSAFIGTDLDLILRSKGVKSLIMTGFSTHCCVESTARDGSMLDYYIVFVSDCTGATQRDRHEGTLANIRDLFGVVVASDEIMSIWSKAGITGAVKVS